jgi:hypothetical protein
MTTPAVAIVATVKPKVDSRVMVLPPQEQG